MTRGTLFVVSTPIGNLADITYRAVEVLREAPRLSGAHPGESVARAELRRTAQAVRRLLTER